MASTAAKFRYQKLRNEGGTDAGDEGEKVLAKPRSSYSLKRVSMKRRFRLKIPGLRRFAKGKWKMASSVRVSFGKVMKRLKESQAHFGDLFAGNYLFMQVSPSSLNFIQKSCEGPTALNGIPSRYSLPKVNA
ncbi:hypothetical protein SLEP1_g19541 [Rubroshorea leprosula]|uniref:Uncharacterized protein n=1 Tax=Rubroshorea leprosula TaxID=152421 RepID=A0AAV5J5L1_9ROSI|nr:hypothetical protein SLEP1_g19541 [Rubroshorea leprosula]